MLDLLLSFHNICNIRKYALAKLFYIKLKNCSEIGMESNWNSFWNSFDSIRKFAIWLIRKGKHYSKNLMDCNSKFIRFDSTLSKGWSQIVQMLDLFNSKIYDSIDSKVLFWFEKFEKNWFEIRSIRFDSTPSWNGIIQFPWWKYTKSKVLENDSYIWRCIFSFKSSFYVILSWFIVE